MKLASEKEYRSLYTPSAWGEEYHAAPFDEVLGAGSAGPGKSLVLLHDPVPQIYVEHERCLDKHHPYYHPWGTSEGWALHLRRTMNRLDQTLDRAHRIFPQIDSGVRISGTTFTFSSGYKFQFDHCKDPGDWRNYYSQQYCMAEGQRILMGDGSLRKIEDVKVGDEVMTLSGPSRVSHFYNTGTKPCVSATIVYRGAIVGTQVFPTTHPVLLWPTAEYDILRFQGLLERYEQSHEPSFVWQDYESLLCGRLRSPVKRVSLIDGQSDFLTSCGELRDISQLPALIAPVVLHEQTVRKALEQQLISNQCCSLESLRSLLQAIYPGVAPHLFEISWSPRNKRIVDRLNELGNGWNFLCGDAYAHYGREISKDSPGSCSFYPYLHGVQPQLQTIDDQDSVPLQACAVEHSHIYHSAHAMVRIREHIPSKPLFYPHFYSGEMKELKQDICKGYVLLRLSGNYQTYDLTVENANHYISEYGLVNSQTHIAYDELVEFEWVQYENITSRCRTGDPVLRPMCRVRSMSNPLLADEGAEKVRVSNPAWVRDYFVQDAPEGRKVLRRKIIRPDGRVEYFTKFYLPATLYDNPDKDFVDDYELRLLSRSEYIRQALLYGNWYAQAGSYYGGDWNPNYHICSPFRIPLHWKRFRSMDWGFKSPGCVLWWAMDDDGNIFCEKELTFQYKPADKVAKMIREIETRLGLWGGRKSKINGPADDQLWEERGDVGKTKAAVMAELGVPWVKADKRSRTTNGLRLLTRIRDHHDFQTTPGIVFFNSCKKCIQTIPSIGTDRNNKECPADGGEDHWHDATLYACAFASYGHKGIRSIPDDDDDDDDDCQPNTSPRSGNFGYWSH